MVHDGREAAFLAVCVALAAAAAAGCYALFGPIGVAALGVGIAFIAVRSELERDAPVGADKTEGLFAATVAARRTEHGDEAPGRVSEASLAARRSSWAKAIGAIVAAVGIGLMLAGD